MPRTFSSVSQSFGYHCHAGALGMPGLPSLCGASGCQFSGYLFMAANT
jgi:hypothetical protein